jgi:hypothetical protein
MIKRMGGFAAPIRLSAIHPPDGISIMPATITRDKVAQIKITADAQLPAGKYKLTLLGVAGNMERAVAIELAVTAP